MNNLSTGKIIIIGIVVVLVAALFFDTQDKKAEFEYKSTVSPVQYENNGVSAFEEGYMEGCMEDSDGSSDFWGPYCQCTYDYISSRKTEDQFFDLAVKYSKDGIEPQIMTDAIDYCLTN